MVKSDFIVYPAIDLRDGQVVRLRQGDPRRQTVYSADPVRVARRWMAEGARWLHVVNLDGAFDELDDDNWTALKRIIDLCKGQVRVQCGGGFRDLETIDLALEAGVSRVVVGTAAVDDPGFAARALNRFGSRVAFALDADRGRIRTHGWQKGSAHTVTDFARFLAANGASTVIYTDISRDGMGCGVDWPTARVIGEEAGLGVIASGGVASLADVKSAKRAGLSGVIVGRALYENQLSLSEALSC